jgi:hypothetical protein
MLYITNIEFYNTNKELDIKLRWPLVRKQTIATDRATAACQRS